MRINTRYPTVGMWKLVVIGTVCRCRRASGGEGAAGGWDLSTRELCHSELAWGKVVASGDESERRHSEFPHYPRGQTFPRRYMHHVLI